MTYDTKPLPVGLRTWFLWVIASSIGLVMGLIVAVATNAITNITILGFGGPGQVAGALAVGVAVAWAIVGIAQWLVLRNRISRAGWWILASSVGGAVGGIIVIVTSQPEVFVAGGAAIGVSVGLAQWLVLRRHVSRAGWWVLGTLAGLLGGELIAIFGVYGAITASVLVWLLKRPVIVEPSLPQESA